MTKDADDRTSTATKDADQRTSTAAAAAARLRQGEHEYGWFGGRANELDDRRHVAFPINGVEAEGDRLTFRFDWKGAIVGGRLYGRSFTGTWRQSTGDGEVALEFAPDFMTAEGWWTLPHEPARHRAFIRRRVRTGGRG
jgi:hypothetical protein